MVHKMARTIYNISSTLPPSMMTTIINNDPTSNHLRTVWVIIQIFLFLISSFCIMCAIAYISRATLVREMKRYQGISVTSNQMLLNEIKKLK